MEILLAVENVPPSFDGPDEFSLPMMVPWEFIPTATDPGLDDIVIQNRTEDVPPGMEELRGGGVRWTPGPEHVGAVWTLTFVAEDSDGATTSQDFRVSVSEGTPLTEPVILSPEAGAQVSDIQPTVKVENPEAPNGELTIYFEVDTDTDFAEPIASGPVPAGDIVDAKGTRYHPMQPDNTTTWTVGKALEIGAQYYVRVWAADVYGNGPQVVSHFWVAAEDGVAGEGPGCECRSVPRPSSAGVVSIALAGLLLALFVWAVRR